MGLRTRAIFEPPKPPKKKVQQAHTLKPLLVEAGILKDPQVLEPWFLNPPKLPDSMTGFRKRGDPLEAGVG